jgi:hypothetical protein
LVLLVQLDPLENVELLEPQDCLENLEILVFLDTKVKQDLLDQQVCLVELDFQV